MLGPILSTKVSASILIRGYTGRHSSDSSLAWKKMPMLIDQSFYHENDCCTIDNECENTLDGEDGASEPAFALRHVGFG